MCNDATNKRGNSIAPRMGIRWKVHFTGLLCIERTEKNTRSSTHQVSMNLLLLARLSVLCAGSLASSFSTATFLHSSNAIFPLLFSAFHASCFIRMVLSFFRLILFLYKNPSWDGTVAGRIVDGKTAYTVTCMCDVPHASSTIPPNLTWDWREEKNKPTRVV